MSPGGTRLRVEVIHAQHGFVCEGVVVRAIKTPSQYQTVRPSGMGVRFLPPGELVEELLPHMATVERPDTQPVSAPAGDGSSDGSAAVPTREDPGQPPQGASASRSPEKGATPTMELDDRVFEVLFRDRERFRKVFDRDVQTGGIFVPTDDPAGIDEVVRVEVRVEGGGSETIEARVVHSVPQTGSNVGGGNILSGMGVQFSDVARAIDRLRALLER